MEATEFDSGHSYFCTWSLVVEISILAKRQQQ
jgi:hypothetical protein